MKRIILTGGGTAGHVTPNMALVPTLKERGYDIQYIGSYDGMEKKLIEDMGIPYHGIATGKLRRYFDLRNFSDPFRVIKGFNEAKKLMKELKPDVVFSKGGFVSVPVGRGRSTAVELRDGKRPFQRQSADAVSVSADLFSAAVLGGDLFQCGHAAGIPPGHCAGV